MELEYSQLSDKELSERLSKLNKRIAYASRTHIHSSALPQMRQIQAHLIIEARGRMEKTKVGFISFPKIKPARIPPIKIPMLKPIA